ncbi:PrsW family intramembrane metalloprotease [Candidatus Peregrinibacteria bacterium]|nr:PrsW family intramembrane metalloprotease [Candidatus Peregrinibacteria bacterium]MBT5517296.1 PrsW family intramembrane metalloprotease [Candidatus Peregrinibacteria bacterium]MBT5823892.1 PrsW family intramembrane metalloprotease [Candidatus Peregrinibacteria bacterium]
MACIPAVIWGYIFYKKDPVYRPKAVQTFLLGIASVLPILLYKWSWEHLPQINIFNYTNQFSADVFSFSPYLFLPLGSVFAFMFVGIIEEYMKHYVVKKSDQGFFRNIDDAIEFSIIAALGFAFLENVLYFYYIWEFQGTEILFVSFVFRSVFSTFAHILFSGIYGYFYGIAYFADPIWAEEKRNKRHPFINFFHTILHMKRNRVFAIEKHSEGLLLAVSLHAVFNILLEMNLTFFMVPFLIFGYSYLDHLFKEKENLKGYGYLVGKNSPAHVHQVLWRKLPHRRKA